MLKPPKPQQCPRGMRTVARKVSELPATCLGLTPGSCPFSLAALTIDRTFLKAEAVHWGLLLERPEEGSLSPWGPCCSLALLLSHTLLRAWGTHQEVGHFPCFFSQSPCLGPIWSLLSVNIHCTWVSSWASHTHAHRSPL